MKKRPISTAVIHHKNIKIVQTKSFCEGYDSCIKDEIYAVELHKLRKENIDFKEQIETLGKVLENREDFERNLHSFALEFKKNIESKAIARRVQELSNEIEVIKSDIERSNAITKEIEEIGIKELPHIKDPFEAAKGILDMPEEEYENLLDKIRG